MSKKFILVACATFCTLTQKFVQGVEYSEADVAKVKDLKNEDEESYFEEIESEDDDAAPKRTLSIGKKGKKDHQTAQEDRGPAGGEDGNTTTV